VLISSSFSTGAYFGGSFSLCSCITTKNGAHSVDVLTGACVLKPGLFELAYLAVEKMGSSNGGEFNLLVTFEARVISRALTENLHDHVNIGKNDETN